jgi:hypothetical protein
MGRRGQAPTQVSVQRTDANLRHRAGLAPPLSASPAKTIVQKKMTAGKQTRVFMRFTPSRRGDGLAPGLLRRSVRGEVLSNLRASEARRSRKCRAVKIEAEWTTGDREGTERTPLKPETGLSGPPVRHNHTV